MSIQSSELKLRLSTQSGSAGNSTAQGNVNNSIGKYISTTDITDNTLNNLFDDITGSQNANSQVDYRCFFLYNSNASLTYTNALVWISNQVSGGATIAIGLDPAGIVAVGSSSAQAAVPADDSTAPAGVTFSNPTSQGTALSIGNLTNGYCQAIWVRRTASNTSPVANDGATISFSGDTL